MKFLTSRYTSDPMQGDIISGISNSYLRSRHMYFLVWH